jgi:hypothetical protein
VKKRNKELLKQRDKRGTAYDTMKDNKTEKETEKTFNS